jgi:hypothetical protein
MDSAIVVVELAGADGRIEIADAVALSWRVWSRETILPRGSWRKKPMAKLLFASAGDCFARLADTTRWHH